VEGKHQIYLPFNYKTCRNSFIFSADLEQERVFQKLDLSAWDVTFIEWINPMKDEALDKYATRLLLQIKTNKPVLIGLSFGGIIAIEVAKRIEIENIILISSVKTKYELPSYYRFSGKLGLIKFLPTSLMKKANLINYWFFGVRSSIDRRLLREVLRDTDNAFFQWAIGRVASWTNTEILPDIFHIHGSSDRILPFRFVQADHTIKGGGHMMVLNKSSEIDALLVKLL